MTLTRRETRRLFKRVKALEEALEWVARGDWVEDDPQLACVAARRALERNRTSQPEPPVEITDEMLDRAVVTYEYGWDDVLAATNPEAQIREYVRRIIRAALD